MITNLAILMCVYRADDVEQFSKAVESILKQDIGPEHEVRIYLHIDGLIPSDLERFIESKDCFYKIIRSKDNVGLAKGLNKLVDCLEDESFLFRMDADDICYPNRLSCQIRYFHENPDVDICGTGITEFTGQENNIVSKRTYPSSHEEILTALTKGSPFAHVTIGFRRRIIHSDFYPTEYGTNEDIALWFKLLKSGVISGNIQQATVNVRMTDAFSRRSASKSLSELKVYLEICQWLNKYPLFPFLRFAFRLMPNFIVKWFYLSNFRQRFLTVKADRKAI